jgi:hypothetical protein
MTDFRTVVIQDGYRRFCALGRETLVADESGMKEPFKRLCRNQEGENPFLLPRFQRPIVPARLHAHLQPALLFRMLNIHVFNTDLAAVGLTQNFKNFSQRRCGSWGISQCRAETSCNESAIKVPKSKSVIGRI